MSGQATLPEHRQRAQEGAAICLESIPLVLVPRQRPGEVRAGCDHDYVQIGSTVTEQGTWYRFRCSKCGDTTNWCY